MGGENNPHDDALTPDNDEVIYGHKNCQTRFAKWLCIDKAYQKFHRPSFYDIGGTYIEDVADFWFTLRTEQVGNIFLMHICVINRNSTVFTVALSYNSELHYNKKNNFVTLSPNLTEYDIKHFSRSYQNYICTFNFTELEVDVLMDKYFYIGVSFHSTGEKGLNQPMIEEIKANHDFRDLLKDPIGADFTMESAEGKEFQVHKVLLSVHSDVFKAMLKEDTAESQNGHVKLVNICTEDLYNMLEFIYTGTVSEPENCNFYSLLMLADQYNIKGLRELSQYALAEQVNVENAIETLLVADLYNSDSLKTKVLQFIKTHPSTLKTNSFKEINNPVLIRELCEYMTL